MNIKKPGLFIAFAAIFIFVAVLVTFLFGSQAQGGPDIPQWIFWLLALLVLFAFVSPILLTAKTERPVEVKEGDWGEIYTLAQTLVDGFQAVSIRLERGTSLKEYDKALADLKNCRPRVQELINHAKTLGKADFEISVGKSVNPLLEIFLSFLKKPSPVECNETSEPKDAGFGKAPRSSGRAESEGVDLTELKSEVIKALPKLSPAAREALERINTLKKADFEAMTDALEASKVLEELLRSFERLYSLGETAKTLAKKVEETQHKHKLRR